MRTVFRLFVAAIVICAIWFAYATFAPVSPHSQQLVLIKPGTSTRGIAEQLDRAGAIRSGNAFLLYHYLLGRRTLKAGGYSFDHPADIPEVYDRIARGDVYTAGVVVPEGYNMFDIATLLEESKVCKRQEFLNVVRTDTALISDLDPQAHTLEGYLFPDTYNFSGTQTPREIAAMMVKRFRKEADAIGLKSNVHRVVTMASIVEKETAVASERPLIAGVFENRLQHNIGLATDPSVVYASLLIGKYDGTIHQSDLTLDSPYNTYKYSGLPPGPIANPGRASLLAAMNPTPTDYLYFVANNKGGHNFAKTIEEHNQNVADYRRGLARAAASANGGKK